MSPQIIQVFWKPLRLVFPTREPANETAVSASFAYGQVSSLNLIASPSGLR